MARLSPEGYKVTDSLALFSNPSLDRMECACLDGAHAYHKGIWQHPYLGEEAWAWDLGWREAEHLDRAKVKRFEEHMAARRELAAVRFMGRARA
jgi:hypothetical protein